MKKLLLVLALVLFTMSSCVQEDSISQVDACGCDTEVFDISGTVTGWYKNERAGGGYDYRVTYDKCDSDEGDNKSIAEALYNDLERGQTICIKSIKPTR